MGRFCDRGAHKTENFLCRRYSILLNILRVRLRIWKFRFSHSTNRSLLAKAFSEASACKSRRISSDSQRNSFKKISGSSLGDIPFRIRALSSTKVGSREGKKGTECEGRGIRDTRSWSQSSNKI